MPAKWRPKRMRVLRERDFALLWSGQAVSLAGNGVFTVALPLEVLRLTGRPIDLGLVASARTIPTVLLLLAGGTVVDRVSRRTVMLASDCVCAISVGLVALLIATGRSGVWELAALSAVFGLASAFFKPASTAIVADILPHELLLPASSLISLSQSAAQFLLGPLLGGLIVAFTGNAWAFGLDAISFVVSAACLAAMRRTEPPPGESSPMLAGMRDGVRYCRSQPWLWWSMIALGIANLACFVPFAIMETLLVRRVFHAGPVALGIMFAASGVGGALASVYAARRPEPRRRVGTIWAAWAGAGAAAAALGLAPHLWVAIALAVATWFGVTYGNILWYPLMQQEVPPELLGRASSVDWMFSLALAPLGSVVGGVLATLFGVRPTLVIGGVIAAATGVVLLVPRVTEPDRRQLLATRPREPDPV